MPGLAVVHVIGHAGRDAEQRFSAAGSAFTNFSVGVTSAKDHTDWYRVTCFGKLAEIAGERVTKGVLVSVVGRLQLREYQAKDGTTKHELDVTASEVVVLERRERPDGEPSISTKEALDELDTIPF